MPDGLLLRVYDRPLQTNATADVASGQSVIPVEWPGRFPDTGGTVRILDVAYPYVSIDDTAGTITLGSALTADVAAGDPIQLEQGGAPAIARDADVLLNGATEPTTFDVPHSLLSLVPVDDETGVYATPWPVTIDDTYSELVNVQNRTPALAVTTDYAGARVELTSRRRGAQPSVTFYPALETDQAVKIFRQLSVSGGPRVGFTHPLAFAMGGGLSGTAGDTASYQVTNGRVSVAHPLGTKPGIVVGQSASVGYRFFYNNSLSNLTTVVFDVRTTTDATPADGTTVGLSWLALVL